jgi:hypothetical protein
MSQPQLTYEIYSKGTYIATRYGWEAAWRTWLDFANRWKLTEVRLKGYVPLAL